MIEGSTGDGRGESANGGARNVAAFVVVVDDDVVRLWPGDWRLAVKVLDDAVRRRDILGGFCLEEMIMVPASSSYQFIGPG